MAIRGRLEPRRTKGLSGDQEVRKCEYKANTFSASESSKRQSMPDHNRGGGRANVLAVTFAIGACTLAMSAWALEPAQAGLGVAHSRNALEFRFASVPAGPFPLGCCESSKSV